MSGVITNPAVVSELKRIAASNGGILRADAVVNEASDPGSPLHQHFEWDDSEAATQWRLRQARDLIRVVVTYEKLSGDKLVPCRVFVSLTPDREEDGGGYRVAATVLSDSDMRRQLLADAGKEMRIFREKYEQLSELAEVFQAMEKVETVDMAHVS